MKIGDLHFFDWAIGDLNGNCKEFYNALDCTSPLTPHFRRYVRQILYDVEYLKRELRSEHNRIIKPPPYHAELQAYENVAALLTHHPFPQYIRPIAPQGHLFLAYAHVVPSPQLLDRIDAINRLIAIINQGCAVRSLKLYQDVLHTRLLRFYSWTCYTLIPAPRYVEPPEKVDPLPPLPALPQIPLFPLPPALPYIPTAGRLLLQMGAEILSDIPQSRAPLSRFLRHHLLQIMQDVATLLDTGLLQPRTERHIAYRPNDPTHHIHDWIVENPLPPCVPLFPVQQLQVLQLADRQPSLLPNLLCINTILCFFNTYFTLRQYLDQYEQCHCPAHANLIHAYQQLCTINGTRVYALFPSGMHHAPN